MTEKKSNCYLGLFGYLMIHDKKYLAELEFIKNELCKKLIYIPTIILFGRVLRI